MKVHDPNNDSDSPEDDSKVEEQSRNDEKRNAALFLSPECQSLTAINALLTPQDKEAGTIKLGALYEEIQSIIKAVSSGDMSRPEEIAMAQITTLDRLFTRLLEISFQNLEQGQFESLLRVAMKAQSQCARTIETLATLKNPAIIANQQLVNNGTMQTPQNASQDPQEAILTPDSSNSSICAFPKTPAREPVPKES